MTPLHWCLAIILFACYGIAIYSFVRALVISTKWDAENFDARGFLKYTFWGFVFSFTALFGSRALSEAISKLSG